MITWKNTYHLWILFTCVKLEPVVCFRSEIVNFLQKMYSAMHSFESCLIENLSNNYVFTVLCTFQGLVITTHIQNIRGPLLITHCHCHQLLFCVCYCSFWGLIVDQLAVGDNSRIPGFFFSGCTINSRFLRPPSGRVSL